MYITRNEGTHVKCQPKKKTINLLTFRIGRAFGRNSHRRRLTFFPPIAPPYWQYITWPRFLSSRLNALIRLVLYDVIPSAHIWLYWCQFSGQEEAERSEPAAAEDDVHAGADPAAGSRIPVGRIRFADETLRAGVGAGIERNSNQNLVPEPSGQRQAHREGPHRPPVQVRKSISYRCDWTSSSRVNSILMNRSRRAWLHHNDRVRVPPPLLPTSAYTGKSGNVIVV